MNTYIISICMFLVFAFNSIANSQDAPANTFCGTPDSLVNFNGPIGTANISVAFVFLDFPDGRLPNGEIPDTDEELNQVSNIDAVLNMGYVSENGQTYNKKVRKYTYDDFWNMYFSTNTFIESAHPDWNSHGIYGYPPDGDTARAYGSFKEYFSEVSYGKLNIIPALTHSNETGIYRTGIVNNITEVNGEKYILPIKLDNSKTSYGIPNSDYNIESNGFYIIIGETYQKLITLYNNNEIDFNLANHLSNGGKIIFIIAGGTYNTGGVTSVPNIVCLREKRSVNNGSEDRFKIINGLTLYCHEFGHTLGFGHSRIGNYCPMSEGTSNQNCPSHFNIIYKLKAGWIDPQYIRFISTNQTVTDLQPSQYNGDCAILTIYGKPGYSEPANSPPDFTHSEFFVLENRRMLREDLNLKFDKKFVWLENRMPIGFNGGCLITHYSPYNQGSTSGIRIKNADPTVPVTITDEGHSNHFFGVQRLGGNGSPFTFLTDNDEGIDRTKSSYDLKTGIKITNINENASGNIPFSLNYSLGEPPNYNRVFYGQTISEPINLSGLYFVHSMALAPDVTVNPGAVFHSIPYSQFGAYINGNSGKFNAIGTQNNPIIFRGVGYAQYVTRGGTILYISNNNINSNPINISYIDFNVDDDSLK